MATPFFKSVDAKQSLPQIEHEMLDFWDRENIFQKSVAARKDRPKYVFFDGPPFANGLPHYGHILANSLKDAVTRYFTMRGYYVPRVNGWDCHGLPVEYEIEKELKISGRKDIEKMGVAKFNTACRKSVFRYTEEWEKLLRRIGRWVDIENGYATLDNNYMESIWWVFSEIWKKGLVYEGKKPMHICPRCETSLSNFEVTLGYKEVADLSTTVKFELIDEPNTYFLAWTTTPWSVLSTMGLAIGPDFDYVKVKAEEGAQYYLAEARLETVFKDMGPYEVIERVKGKKLVGKRYRHVFDYFNDHPEVKASKNAFHTVGTDYVSTEDGTGIVTINGAFGEIDFEAAQKNKLPVIVNVGTDGHFTKENGEFSGMFVKAAEAKIAEHLQKTGGLFRKDSIKHSYPHCWRCDTPLLNYATKSWFVKVTAVKDQLIANNKKIHWVPDHIQEGRFGKWLEGARDWNISRNRFWGCPIPVWQCECGEQKCIGSLKELREASVGGNNFFVVRHGEATQNKARTLNSNPEAAFHLTDEGKGQAHEAGKKLKGKKIDMIFCSNFPRAQETAEIIAEAIDVKVTVDDRLREHDLGKFDGKELDAYLRSFADVEERYYSKAHGGESFEELEKRVIEYINYLNCKYSGKNIVVVTHGDVIRAIARYFDRLSIEETFNFRPGLAGIYEYKAGTLPLRDGQLDLHKPYIDEIELSCEKCGKGMKRITEVLDCWFESGAMPYAQLHYPFENKKEFEENFPANFIAEGLDQTRGWFYTLHVLATILFNKPAFKNVIVNGILLAANGEKLSKRKKNYPDPNELFEKFGVDSTRFFLYTSTAPMAEDVRFSEKHVEEMVKKFTLTLWNTYSFFVTYANIDGWKPQNDMSIDKGQKWTPTNKLDKWILSELHELVAETTKCMDEYQLTKATRPLMNFVDILSNWYVRRSRRRFWKSENDGDKNEAYFTLHTVLVTLAKLLAPFMPSIAETIYKNLTGQESVHMQDWPAADTTRIEKNLNEEMRTIRTIVSLALRIRAKKNIKVRQPLSKLILVLPAGITQSMIESYREVLLEEINAKELAFEKEGRLATPVLTVDPRKIGPRFGQDTQKIIIASKKGDYAIQPDGRVTIPAKGPTAYTLEADEVIVGYKGKEGFDVESDTGMIVALDTAVTPELQDEGNVRDIVRALQELRKKADYGISDRIYVYVKASKELQKAVTTYAEFIAKETLAVEIQEGGDFEWDREDTIEIEGESVKVGVRRPN